MFNNFLPECGLLREVSGKAWQIRAVVAEEKNEELQQEIDRLKTEAMVSRMSIETLQQQLAEAKQKLKESQPV